MADSSGAAQIAKTLTHDNLIDLVCSFFLEMSDEGVCCGVTSMWLQARVTGKQQENEFYHRLDGIAAYLAIPGNTVQSLKQEIMAGYEARKKAPGQPLSELENLEIHAFCEMVALHQDPAKPSMILGREIGQMDKKNQYLLTASQVLIAENKTIKYDIAGLVALNQQGLVKYLDDLQEILEKENKKKHLAPDKERAFLLASDDHAVGLAFNFKIKKWHFFDVNLLDDRKEYYIEVESADLAPIIVDSFFDSQSQNDFFSIYCVSTTHDQSLVSEIKGKSHDLLKQSIGKKNDRDVQVLGFAIREGDIESVKVLIEAGVDVNAPMPSGKNKTALMLASKYGHAGVVNDLIQAGADVNAPGLSGWTALMIASYDGHTEVVNALIKVGANINLLEESGKTALMIASKKGHAGVVKALLEARGVEVNAQLPNGLTALMIAIKKGHAGVVNALLKSKAGIDVNVVGPSGWTALMIASYHGHTEVVNALLEASANVNALDPDDSTALMMASSAGHTEAVNALIKAGANVNAQHLSGKTALMIASEDGHAEIVEALIKAGANVNSRLPDGKTALMIASENGHAEVEKTLLDAEVVKILLNAGADVNTLEPSAKTALMLASKKNHAEFDKAFFDTGAGDQPKSGGQKPKC